MAVLFKNSAYLSELTDAQIGQDDGNGNYVEAAPLAFCGDTYHYLHAWCCEYDGNDSTAAPLGP